MRLCIFLLILAACDQARAISISIDLVSGLPGIQKSAAIAPDREFEVDVVINQLQSRSSVQSYAFNLLFDPDIVEAKKVSPGNFVSGEFGEQIESSIALGLINFSLFAFGNASHDLTGVLAKIIFQTKSKTSTELILNQVELADTSIPSLPISIDEINNATVNEVPLPPSLGIFFTAIIFLTGSRVLGHKKPS